MKTGVAGLPADWLRRSLSWSYPSENFGYNPHSAQILHVWGIARGSSCRFSFWPARWVGRPSRLRKPGTLAPPAGLRPRRPHEDRARYGPNLVWGEAWQDHSLADLRPDREPRLE